jgi:hypothetical protein
MTSTRWKRAAQFLAEVSEVVAGEALRANAKAVELLPARCWYVMKSAREACTTLGTDRQALGITKQAAHDFYRRRVEVRGGLSCGLGRLTTHTTAGMATRSIPGDS